jgi:dihydroneopterin aldolase
MQPLVADRIEIRGLRVHGFHGVRPEERRDGQVFVIDATVDIDTAPAAAGDELAATVDYSALAERLHAVVAGEPVDLLETLAARLADVCLVDSRVTAAEVSVHKPQAPVGVPVDDVVVTIQRTRR